MQALTRPRKSHRLLLRAIVASLALHVLFALLLPRQMPDQTSGRADIETLTVATISRISVERRSPHRAASRARARTQPKPKPPVTHARTSVSVHPHGRYARRPVARAPSPQTAVLGSPAPQSNGGAVPAAAPAKVAVVARAAATAGPRVLPTEQPIAAKADSGGVMPFGAALPEPVLDPNVRNELSRRFGKSHATLTVTVGDDGKTKDVRIAPPLDAQTEGQIRRLLAVANWDAAVCGGGIACEGQAVIRL